MYTLEGFFFAYVLGVAIVAKTPRHGLIITYEEAPHIQRSAESALEYASLTQLSLARDLSHVWR